MKHYIESCHCGSGEEAESITDGYNIHICYACPECKQRKLAGYRDDIFQAYDCDEPIEDEL